MTTDEIALLDRVRPLGEREIWVVVALDRIAKSAKLQRVADLYTDPEPRTVRVDELVLVQKYLMPRMPPAPPVMSPPPPPPPSPPAPSPPLCNCISCQARRAAKYLSGQP